MAIPVVQDDSEQKENTNVEETTITAPANITNGDVLMLAISTDGNSVFTFPTGFIEINQGFGTSNRCAGGLAYKIADGESGNYLVTWTGGVEESIANIYRIDGAVSGSEVFNPNEEISGQADPWVITPVASTDTDDSLVFVMFSSDHNDINVDAGTGAPYTQLDVDQSSTNNGACSYGTQTLGIATAAVPDEATVNVTAAEQYYGTWCAVRSIAPAAGAPRRIFIT